MNHVFISYARDDAEITRAIAEGLRRHGLDVYMDREIAPGERWRSAIQAELEQADVVLVLWSAASVQSEWVRAEADLGRQQEKYFPALIERVNVPLGFSQYQTLDLTGIAAPATSAGSVEILAREIHRYLGRSPRAITEPPQPDTPGDHVVTDPRRQYKRLRKASQLQLFFAHATADKPKLRPIAEILIDQGFRVWIDKPQAVGLSRDYKARIALDRIQYGSDWKESIRRAMKKADVVLAFWSHDAVNGRREQFHYEVYMGMMQRKLSQCRVDNVDFEEIGMPYTFDHIADLSTLQANVYHSELDYLMEDLVSKHRPWWRLL